MYQVKELNKKAFWNYRKMFVNDCIDFDDFKEKLELENIKIDGLKEYDKKEAEKYVYVYKDKCIDISLADSTKYIIDKINMFIYNT